MKVTVERYIGAKEWRVRVTQGVQSFRLAYSGPKYACKWMARMFRKALKAHDMEKKK